MKIVEGVARLNTIERLALEIPDRDAVIDIDWLEAHIPEAQQDRENQLHELVFWRDMGLATQADIAMAEYLLMRLEQIEAQTVPEAADRYLDLVAIAGEEI